VTIKSNQFKGGATPPKPTIRIACDVRDSLPLDDLVELQEDLKFLSDDDAARLDAEILDTGFAFPVRVWREKKGRSVTNFIVGGHQSTRRLRFLREEKGYEIPRVPVVYVVAKDIVEARRRVLQDVAQYGQIRPDALQKFMQQARLDLGQLRSAFRLPDVDMKQFERSMTPVTEPKPPDSFPEHDGQVKTTYTCPKCGFAWS
jgi:hypothetical protein